MYHLRDWWCPLCLATSVHYVVKPHTIARSIVIASRCRGLRRRCGCGRLRAKGPVPAGEESTQADHDQGVDAVEPGQRRDARMSEHGLNSQKHEKDAGQDGRPPWISGPEREPDHDQDGQADEVSVDRVEAGEVVGVLESGIDIFLVVVGVDDGEYGRSYEIELRQKLEHQDRARH